MMGLSLSFPRATALTIAAAAGMVLFVQVQDAAAKSDCTAPSELIRLHNPLKRMTAKIAAGQPVKIVAIGSSSTAGAGASSPAMNYPSRLQAELQALMPRIPVEVLNRGINGEEAPDMVARFERDVFAEQPDLVLWQVGSNSVLRDRPIREANAQLKDGLKRLREHGADVILINPQYAPKVIAKHEVDAMVDLIDSTAKQTNVDLFQRYALMRYWRLTEDIPFSVFTSADDLHMNDWSYGCIAKLLAGSIHEAATRPTLTATVKGRP
jgi:acyl-CoA thioesterase-1